MDTCQLGIIADDLTGAMDSTGAAATQGLKSVVVLSPTIPAPQGEWHVVCYNTQSRLSSARDAEKAVTSATRQLQEHKPKHLYKKIDSTLRGNIGIELLSMMNTLGATKAIICPAFPDMRRTVANGILYVNGQPLTSSAAGKDPFNTIPTSSVVDLIAQQTGQEIGLVKLSEIEQGDASIQHQINNNRHKILVLDATTKRHLTNIAEALTALESNTISVGSAGLASALTEMLSQGINATDPRHNTKQRGRTLLISGSLSHTTRSQIAQLQDKAKCHIIGMNAASILTSAADLAKELTRIKNEALTASESKQDIALNWQDPETIETVLKHENANPTERSEKLSRLISFTQTIAADLLAELSIGSLILVGGETAYTVLSGLGARAVELIGEVQSGIPSGRIIGGTADGNLIITKAGGFGDHNALANAMNYARSARET